ncbi:MAG TPA: Pls/PosA family non-ribosomal peptide synthetase [Amycolatopsis sp.]|uniref:Pls/PosA family non-ribosomal peptide synthetase n=1 Tax=Amycolatopsis sp. TaxID=37632 RepID=UPI002B48CE6A|nr:Pls/PosA family non-ribosomal peptide synthetase [Amycolatopsis sp.]HKS48249.1 Pls/PosA family non-ribosomal peptide synthetase [Amycolatopsis sp.]
MSDSVEVLRAGPAGSPVTEEESAGPATPAEKVLAQILAEVMRVEEVAADRHFFADLGADSLVMAHFCARVRKRPGLPPVSMKDVYRHPTIRSLATALAGAAPAPAAAPPAEAAAPVRDREYFLCGTLQLLTFLGYSFLSAVIVARAYDWISVAPGFVAGYLRAVMFGGAGFIALCALPILAKWVLIGRWRPREIRIWSLAYFRFWVVKTLVRANPLLLLIGGRSHTSASSPLYVLYLRALGAKIGRGVAIFSRNVPVCTDLLAIGDGTVIRKDSYFNGYRARAGIIQTGPVTLGRNAFVGEATVLDIGTSLGDGAQLGHASSLHSGQSVPDGETWNGSPAQRAEVDYQVAGPAGRGRLRRAGHGVLQLLCVLGVYLPLTFGGAGLVLAEFPQFTSVLDTAPLAFTSWTFYRDALIVSSVGFFGFVLVGLLVVVSVPRALNLMIKPDRDYPLYGFHYWIHLVIGRLTNVKLFTGLFGDSSYIVHYLRCLGYDLTQVEQTGSNFGTVFKHENPYLVSVGRGTMIADGLSIINADFSSTSFRLTRARIGPCNFLGNGIAYPAQSRTGDNCLLATMVMVPLDGEARKNTGLLGAPSFRIPRSVERDSRFDHLKSAGELRGNLAAKNKYNLRSMAWFLLLRWAYLFGLMLLLFAAADFYRHSGVVGIAVEFFSATLYTVVYFVLVERGVARFRPMTPKFCSIYHRYFWWHERFWKLATTLDSLFAGTPFKNVISRLLGVRVGRRVFDDGCAMPEKSLVTIGDYGTLNMGSTVQCHSQEDGTFKSGYSRIGAGCTLETGSFVHYGVTMGDGAVLGPGSFLMKGEEIPAHARWAGNPARNIEAR